MLFPLVLLKILRWVLYQLLANSCYKAAKKMTNYVKTPSHKHHPLQFPNLNHYGLGKKLSDYTIVCDMHGALLRTDSFFPYFMLVAFEGGSIFRALLLLLSCPLLCLLDYESQLRVMIFVTFCGLKVKNMEIVSRSVLPKFYLENMNLQAYEVFSSTGRRIVFTSVPSVMVEDFSKNYLKVNDVKGTELHSVGKFYSGLLGKSGLVLKHKAVKEYFGGDETPDIGLGSSCHHDHLFMSLCKEAYEVSKHGPNSVMPREKYPKPLIFHDGRLAFLPTPLATLTMFMWLPLGIFLAIFRILIGIFLPYKLILILGSWSGIDLRIKGCNPKSSSPNKGLLYVCTHRTLLDPVFLSARLQKPLTAVTYSLSKMSEVIAPIKTVRLTRDRKQDGEIIEKLLSEGDLVVCPEGTTCREPYLLRFSSLFAELGDEMVPVAINTRVSMFYGTTASGLKCLDPIFFLMNPRPSYHMQVLEKLPRELTCGGGGKSSCEVANYIQRQLGDALGFECTSFTRKDKYLMLAGNEGNVEDVKRKKP